MNVLLLLTWLLPPSRLKNRLLRALGHPVHATARANINLVWKVGRMELGPGAQLHRGNVFKHLRVVRLGENTIMGSYNVVSAHPKFLALYEHGASLELGRESFLTSLHHLDCSGSISIGELAGVAGHQTRIMTHSIDVARNAQAAYPIEIGARSFTGARCLLLGGARLPERSVLAAGSTLIKDGSEMRPGLYTGSPARFKREVEGAWFDREEGATTAIWDPTTNTLTQGD